MRFDENQQLVMMLPQWLMAIYKSGDYRDWPKPEITVSVENETKTKLHGSTALIRQVSTDFERHVETILILTLTL